MWARLEGGCPLSFNFKHCPPLGLLPHRLHGRHICVGVNLHQVGLDVVHCGSKDLQLFFHPIKLEDWIWAGVKSRLSHAVLEDKTEHIVAVIFRDGAT